MMEKNEARIAAYSRAAKKWQTLWPRVQKQARGLPLREAHRLLLDNALTALPKNLNEFD